MRAAPLLLLLALTACSATDESSDVGSDDTASPSDATQPPDETPACVSARTLGQPCTQDCECLTGLCLLNEWAPFRFCSADCSTAQPGNLCPADPGATSSTSLCVELPTELDIPPHRFCVPLCNNGVMDCKATGSAWETCGTPQYKEAGLFDTSDQVCMAPSANGHAPIDPDTCTGWQDLFSAYPEIEPACSLYCQFLKECLFLPAGKSLACCPYACARYVAPDSVPDSTLMDLIGCHNQHFSAFQGTGKACEEDPTCGEVVVLEF